MIEPVIAWEVLQRHGGRFRSCGWYRSLHRALAVKWHLQRCNRPACAYVVVRREEHPDSVERRRRLVALAERFGEA